MREERGKDGGQQVSVRGREGGRDGESEGERERRMREGKMEG